MIWNAVKALLRAFVTTPFHDEAGRKGIFERFTRAQPHHVRRLSLTIPGWPQWSRPLRIAFLSDLHVGSHSGDLDRLRGIVAEMMEQRPDLVLYGGDFVNMQPFGGGRIPPRSIAAVLAGLRVPLGAYAALGNHDHSYGVEESLAALRTHGIASIDDRTHEVTFEGVPFDLIGIPDSDAIRPRSRELLAALDAGRPAIVVAHDPVYFGLLPAGPHVMLAGHTHGGQICIPGIGPFMNMSAAPLRWTYGLIEEDGRRMYVTSGVGTSALPFRMKMPPEIVLIELTGAL